MWKKVLKRCHALVNSGWAGFFFAAAWISFLSFQYLNFQIWLPISGMLMKRQYTHSSRNTQVHRTKNKWMNYMEEKKNNAKLHILFTFNLQLSNVENSNVSLFSKRNRINCTHFMSQTLFCYGVFVVKRNIQNRFFFCISLLLNMQLFVESKVSETHNVCTMFEFQGEIEF